MFDNDEEPPPPLSCIVIMVGALLIPYYLQPATTTLDRIESMLAARCAAIKRAFKAAMCCLDMEISIEVHVIIILLYCTQCIHAFSWTISFTKFSLFFQTDVISMSRRA